MLNFFCFSGRFGTVQHICKLSSMQENEVGAVNRTPSGTEYLGGYGCPFFCVPQAQTSKARNHL